MRGFDRAAAVYERSRPDYPAELVRDLADRLSLGPRSTIVELASGTGKFTRALRPVGAAIVAVEPTAGMRAVFESVVPEVAAIDGTAEAIPLPDGFADAVVAAQAFHWFRPGPALREIARVLRPGGGLALVWNTRDESVPVVRRLSEVLHRYRGSAPWAREAAWRAAFDRPRSSFGRLRHRRYRHVQRLDPTTFVDRALSVSYVAARPARERRRIAREVAAILEEDPATRDRATIALPYATDLYWTRRR